MIRWEIYWRHIIVLPKFWIVRTNFDYYLFLAKSAKSTKSAKSEAKDDAKSDITDGNNTSAAETTIPLDEDTGKPNGDLSTKSGMNII